jgi:hypothetical protein
MMQEPPDDIPLERVQEVFEAITDALGTQFTFDEFLNFVEKVFRKKPLIIERVPMPSDRSGECRALIDVDLLRVEQDLDEVSFRVVASHEVSHLLLDHVLLTLQTLEEYRQDPEKYPALFRDNSESIIREGEAEAFREGESEALGTLVCLCVYMDEKSLPASARTLHGEG